MNGSLDLYPPKQLQSLQTGQLISAIGLFCCFVRESSDGRTGGNLGEGFILYFYPQQQHYNSEIDLNANCQVHIEFEKSRTQLNVCDKE